MMAKRFISWFVALGLFLTGIGGAFLPWIWRESVALQLTGPGLAEFVKFLPEVRTKQVDIERLFFLLPLFVSMLALPIVVENKKLDLPTWLRWGLRLAVIPLALASISPVWAPEVLIDQEFRLQTLLAGLAIGLAVIAPLLKSLPLKIVAVLLLGGGLAAIILPMWQFSLIQPSMVEVYHEPVSLGWGWWLTVGGIVLSIVGGIFALMQPQHQPLICPKGQVKQVN
jgi:hypothetical protein